LQNIIPQEIAHVLLIYVICLQYQTKYGLGFAWKMIDDQVCNTPLVMPALTV